MKRIRLTTFLFITSLFIHFSGFAVADTQQELIFNTQNFPPFSYIIDGVVSGPVSEIIRGVCYEMNINCRFKLLDWSKVQKEVKEENSEISFVNLADSKCDSVFSNKAVGVSTINKLRLKKIKYAGSQRKLDYYIGFNKKTIPKAFVENFNNTLKKLNTNGVIGHILAMYDLR